MSRSGLTGRSTRTRSGIAPQGVLLSVRLAPQCRCVPVNSDVSPHGRPPNAPSETSLSIDYDEFNEGDDYERPRDDKIDDAKEVLRSELFATDDDAVFYQRQIETRYEGQFFHWITAKAVNELAAERVFSSETVPLLGNASIRFYWSPKNRYWKRRANAIRKLVLAFSESSMSHAIGRQGEVMFDAALPRVGLLPVPPYKNVKSFADRAWTKTKHDLDRVFARDGITYGVEIKNTLSYIDKDELDIKLEMCAHLGLRPLFVMRMAPKSYMYQIQQRGGFGLIFGKQLYPYGQEAFAKTIQQELRLPVDCIRDVPEGHLQRFNSWHQALVARLAKRSST
jgi:hypothetical protein